MDRKSAWGSYNSEQLEELEQISKRYKSCLDAGKTERECVELGVRMAQEAGYRDLNEVMAAGESLGYPRRGCGGRKSESGRQGIRGLHEQDAGAFPPRGGAAFCGHEHSGRPH